MGTLCPKTRSHYQLVIRGRARAEYLVYTFCFSLALLALTTFANGRNDRDVVLHHGGGVNGHELVYIDPPRVIKQLCE